MTRTPNLNAADGSRWGGPLIAEHAVLLKQNGIRLWISGTGDAHPGGAGEFARQQVETWIAAGGEFADAYVWLGFAGDPVAQVATALASLDGLPIRRWWLDCEDPAAPGGPLDRVLFIGKAIGAALRTLPPSKIGIYSGRWWWIPYTGDSTAAADAGLPLWNSYYDGNPDQTGLPYGGWAAGARPDGRPYSPLEQFAGTTTLCGQSVDLNWAADLPEGEDVNVTEIEDVKIAIFAGSEQRDEQGNPKPRADRLAYAEYRIAEIVAGTAPSVAEIAAAPQAPADHAHTAVATTKIVVGFASPAVEAQGLST